MAKFEKTLLVGSKLLLGKTKLLERDASSWRTDGFEFFGPADNRKKPKAKKKTKKKMKTLNFSCAIFTNNGKNWIFPGKEEETKRIHMSGSSSASYDEVDLEDMEWNEELKAYTYSCPCGDIFRITLDELHDGEEIARCPSCSLILTVIYDPDELPARE